MLNNLEDSRIIYLKNKENLGASASRNRGVKAAKGKFISFLDDDDYYLPNNISSKIKTYKASTEDNLGLIYGWTESRDENNRLIKQYKYCEHGKCLYKAMFDCISATSQWMCTKDAFMHVKGFSELKANEDWQFIVKLIAAGYSIDYVPEIISLYYEHSGMRKSMGNIDNLQGQIQLRSYFRKLYSRLSKKEADNVEYHVSYNIFYLSIYNREYRRAIQEYKHIKNTIYGKKAQTTFAKYVIKKLTRYDKWRDKISFLLSH